jgi:hypothetical protein
MPSLVNDLTHFCPVPSSERSRDAEVVPWTKDLHLLRIWGRFPPGWAGLLSLGLSHAQLAIVRGYARKVPQGHWLAEFQIRPLPGAPDPKQVDYVELALTGPTHAEREPIVLESYFVDRAPDHGGALFLEVRGEDRMGFLGSLLDGLAGASLFPEEMRIETRGNVAFDRFQLRGLGGRLPSEDARRALDGLLEGLMPRPRVAPVRPAPIAARAASFATPA